MHRRALLLLFLASGCASYEYEEEVFLEADGSGEIRMSGSTDAVAALHGLEEVTTESAGALLRGNGVEVLSTRATERDGRRFVHVEARFSDWESLCRVPAFSGRGCRFVVGEGDLVLDLTLPSPPGPMPVSTAPDSLLALRFHLPGTIRQHDSDQGVERGNILSWEQTFQEHFGGRPLALQVRFDRRTILGRTLGIVGVALALVLASIAAAIFLMVRKGRRELEAEAIASRPSRPGHPSGG
jgi:hypothetical protein